MQLSPAQAANHPKRVVDQPCRENPVLRQHWQLQEFLRSPKGGLRPLSSSSVSFAQYERPGAPHRQGVHLEPLGRTLPNSLQRRAHCRRLFDTEDFSAAYDRRAGRSADPRRGHQSHKSSKEWHGCRRRWHPARSLEAWRRSTALQTSRALRMLLGTGKTTTKPPKRYHHHSVQEQREKVRLLKPQGDNSPLHHR